MVYWYTFYPQWSRLTITRGPSWTRRPAGEALNVAAQMWPEWGSWRQLLSVFSVRYTTQRSATLHHTHCMWRLLRCRGWHLPVAAMYLPWITEVLKLSTSSQALWPSRFWVLVERQEFCNEESYGPWTRGKGRRGERGRVYVYNVVCGGVGVCAPAGVHACVNACLPVCAHACLPVCMCVSVCVCCVCVCVGGDEASELECP